MLIRFYLIEEKGVISMKERTEKLVASKIVNLACNTVKNSVGKSMPVALHEVEMPESVRKEFINKDIEA